jgi:hypothetical protein
MTTARREAKRLDQLLFEQHLITNDQLERSLADDRRTPEVDRVMLSREFSGLLQELSPDDETSSGRPSLEGP